MSIAPTGVLDGRAHSLCHIPLRGGGTQLALYQELAGPEGSIAAGGGAHGHVPGSTIVVKIELQFSRPSFTSPRLHLKKEPFVYILIGLTTRPSVVPQQVE